MHETVKENRSNLMSKFEAYWPMAILDEGNAL